MDACVVLVLLSVVLQASVLFVVGIVLSPMLKVAASLVATKVLPRSCVQFVG